MTPGTLDISLHAQQGKALMTDATEALYGGAAGGGKSHLFRAAGILWACQVPGLQAYLFRRLFPELQQNHMEGPTSFPVLLAPLVKSGHVTIVRSEIRFWNGSRIFLRHCQHEKSIYSYQGTEIHLLLIDELTHWTENMYRYLRGRLRLGALKMPEEHAGKFPRVLCGTNPGGVGHHWVKRTFVDHGAMVLHRAVKEEGGMMRQYIPARLEDNPTLLASDPDYVDRLEGLGDGMLVRALKEGDWNVVAGAMFGAAWRASQHVCRPFPIPDGWELWRGADDGFASPAACYWLTRNPDTGTYYVLGELYKKAMLPDFYAEKVIARDMAIELTDGHGQSRLNESKLRGLMDSGAFAEIGTGQNVPSRGQQMNDLGCRWEPVEKGPGSRVRRVQNFHRLLAANPKDPKGGPGIVFFDTCVEAIRTIPTLCRDGKNIEDVDTDGEDHAFDGVTYGLQWREYRKAKVRVRGT